MSTLEIPLDTEEWQLIVEGLSWLISEATSNMSDEVARAQKLREHINSEIQHP